MFITIFIEKLVSGKSVLYRAALTGVLLHPKTAQRLNEKHILNATSKN
jgi:hypothetical protein